MKIVEPGKKELIEKLKRFECRNCGCKFEAEKGEYETGEHYNDIFYKCNCPCCGESAVTK